MKSRKLHKNVNVLSIKKYREEITKLLFKSKKTVVTQLFGPNQQITLDFTMNPLFKQCHNGSNTERTKYKTW